MRLQKYLAQAGVASRRGAEEMIKSGRVAVDGMVVTAMGVRLDPEVQRVTCDGVLVTPEAKKIYILLHKPVGYITTVRDTHGRPTVLSLLKNVSERVFPVGRLDLDTSGALLLTNDGDFSQKILHPSFQINRTYRAWVCGTPSREAMAALAHGVELDGRRTAPARVRIVDARPGKTALEIIIHEGRKRQVRRMCEQVGHRVTALQRLAYGGLSLGGLQPGDFRFLSPADRRRIFSSTTRPRGAGA